MGFKKWSFNPSDDLGVKLSKDSREETLEDVAAYVKESLLSYIGEGKSPVKGGKWVRGLTPEYKLKKGEESSSDFANLELYGDLLDSLEVTAKGNRIEISVGEDQYGKAEGHYTGIYGANSKSERPRQFMPQGEDELRSDIMRGIRQILEEAQDE